MNSVYLNEVTVLAVCMNWIVLSRAQTQCGERNRSAYDAWQKIYIPSTYLDAVTYGPNMSCEWMIVAPPGYQVDLEIVNGNAEECCDKLVVSSGDKWLGNISGTIQETQQFVSSNGSLLLQFTSDKNINYFGYEGRYRRTNNMVTTTPGPPRDKTCGPAVTTAEENTKTICIPFTYYQGITYKPNLVCEWRINAPPGYQVELVVIRGLTHVFDVLQISTGGQVIGKVSGIVRTMKQFVSTDGSLLLRFTTDSNVQLFGYEAWYHIHKGTPFQFDRMQQISQSAANTTVTAPQALEFFFIHSRPCGFNAEALDVARTFKTPNYPNVYPISIVCEWTFTAPPGKHVKLHLTDGATEYQVDVLEAFSANQSVGLISGWLHWTRMSSFLSIDETLTVRFRSDSFTQYRGYAGWYKVSEGSVTVGTFAMILIGSVIAATIFVVPFTLHIFKKKLLALGDTQTDNALTT